MVKSLGDTCERHGIVLQLVDVGHGKQELQCPMCQRQRMEDLRELMNGPVARRHIAEGLRRQ